MNNGGLLGQGYNGKQSYVEAFNWGRNSCRLPVAMNNIGRLYAKATAWKRLQEGVRVLHQALSRQRLGNEPVGISMKKVWASSRA